MASRGLKIKKEILKQNQSSNFFSTLIPNGFGHASVSQDTNGENTRKRKTFTGNGVVPWVCDTDHRRFVCSWSFLHNYTHPETEYGTRPLTVILNSSGLGLAGTVSVLKVRRAIGQENF
jgi:hypothetical protein